MSMEKPYVVGLTGGIACGKSAVSGTLQGLGAVVLDADGLSRELTEDGGAALPRIREIFGDGFFREDGTLDRDALGSRVFSDEPSRRALEGIIHPMVQRQVMDRLDECAEKGERLVFLEVPLLFETGMDVLCDEVWVVTASHDAQVRRVIERDGKTAEEAEARIAAQMPAEDRNSRANVLLRNDGDLNHLSMETAEQYNALLRRLARA